MSFLGDWTLQASPTQKLRCDFLGLSRQPLNFKEQFSRTTDREGRFSYLDYSPWFNTSCILWKGMSKILSHGRYCNQDVTRATNSDMAPVYAAQTGI